MKFLDCYCGKGGASEGFYKEGFDCTGIDIVDVGYPYKLILADFRKLNGGDFKGYDVIWGSPPCRDFSNMAKVGKGSHRTDTERIWKWANPPNPQGGLELVWKFLSFIQDAKPKIWIMENVSGLIPYLKIRPVQVSRITKTKKRAFWGNYPSFLMPTQKSQDVYKIQGKNRKWERAKIPLACSQAFAKACREQLEKVP